MNRKILSVLSVLMAVLMSTAALSACNKTPAGAENSGGSSKSLSTEQGGEPSVSESAAESSEEGGAQSDSTAENEQRTVLFKELNEEYLPLYGILINVEEWNSADRIDIEMFYAWYTDYIAATMQYETRKALYSIDGEPGWHYPAVEFEDFIQKYFYISTKVLRKSDVYNKNEDCYTIPAGGWGKNYNFSVVSPDDISISGSTATAKLTCVSNLDSSTIYMYLSIDISEKPYKFIGCKSGAHGENTVQPEGIFLAEWGGFSVYLPEESVLAGYGEQITVSGDALCAGGGDNATEFAKIISVDQTEDSAAPFAAYDERYTDAESVRDGVFGGKKCRSYDFQTEVQTEAFGTVYENKTIYCLILGDKIVVIEFNPLRGMGIDTQKEEFEKIIGTLSA